MNEEAHSASVASSSRPKKTAQQGSRRRTGEKKTKSEEEVQRNRLVQAKYRQRVKERQEQLAGQYEAACSDLERELQQIEDLTRENTVLEQVLALRDDWIAALEQGSTASCSIGDAGLHHWLLHRIMGPHPYALTPVSIGHGNADLSSAGSASVEGREAGGTAGQVPGIGAQQAQQAPPAPAAAAGAKAGLSSVLPPLDPIAAAADRLGHLMAAAAAAGSGPDGQPSAGADRRFNSMEVLRTVQLDPEVVARVRSSTPEQVIRSWTDFHNRVRDLLAQYDMTNSESSLGQLKLLLEQWGLLVAVLLIHNPDNLQRLAAAQIGGQLPAEEEQEKWDAVLASLDLSPAQQRHYLRLLAAYEGQVQLLQRNKEEAFQLVRQGTEDPDVLKSMGLNLLMASYLRAWEGVGALHAYPNIMFVATLQLMGKVTLDWTPLQKARMLTGGGPNFPDIFGVLHAIKRATGSPASDTSPIL